MRFLFATILALFAATLSHAQSYDLEVGDVIAIEVLEDASLNRNALVLPDGNITFPFAGTIRAAGRSVAQVQESLTQALAPNFAAAPTVFVSISELRSPPEPSSDITIFVIGEVGAPGQKELERGTTFLQALASTGGFTPFAATKRIQLRRTDPSSGEEAVFTFNLRAAGDGARISGNAPLRDGDVILVPERRLFE